MTSISINSPVPAFDTSAFRRASPLLWTLSLAFIAGFVICSLLTAIDPRLFNGISVWIKPAKFFLSLAVHMLTLNVGLMLLPEAARLTRGTQAAIATIASMAVFEIAYITFRAARAEASHFNDGSALAGILYSLMGAGAAAIMLATAWIGWQVLRHSERRLIAGATGWSFLIAAAATLVIGFTLGGMGSHWIGGDQTDASGLPVFGWSTTGGDLRISHFIGLHIMQALPLAALMGKRGLVVATGALGLLATAATYVLALMGLPLIAI